MLILCCFLFNSIYRRHVRTTWEFLLCRRQAVYWFAVQIHFVQCVTCIKSTQIIIPLRLRNRDRLYVPTIPSTIQRLCLLVSIYKNSTCIYTYSPRTKLYPCSLSCCCSVIIYWHLFYLVPTREHKSNRRIAKYPLPKAYTKINQRAHAHTAISRCMRWATFPVGRLLRALCSGSPP